MHETARALLKAQSDIALLNQQIVWLIKRVDTLEKADKTMTGQLDGVQASVVALQNAQAGFIQDAQRVLSDLQAAQAKLSTGEDITGEASAIQAQLDAMTNGLTSAKATLDAGDLAVAAAPAAEVTAPVVAPATDVVPPVAS